MAGPPRGGRDWASGVQRDGRDEPVRPEYDQGSTTLQEQEEAKAAPTPPPGPAGGCAAARPSFWHTVPTRRRWLCRRGPRSTGSCPAWMVVSTPSVRRPHAGHWPSGQRGRSARTRRFDPASGVQIDTTPPDVMALLEDRVRARLELTMVTDQATRTICAGVLRPPGTKAVDAALLLLAAIVEVVDRSEGVADRGRSRSRDGLGPAPPVQHRPSRSAGSSSGSPSAAGSRPACQATPKKRRTRATYFIRDAADSGAPARDRR